MVAQRKVPDSPVKLEILKVGSIGIIQDRQNHSIPSAAWTNGKNVRFKNESAVRMEGHSQTFGTPTVTPYAIFNVPGINDQTFWFYFSLAKAYVVESGVHSNVTRVASDYTTVSGRTWGGCILGGIPIFNNGVDKPQYWSALSVATPLIDLTAWPANSRARVVKNFGSYLIAMNMTESGTNKPHKVLISHKAGPGTLPSSWDDTDPTVDATSFELTDVKGGELFDGLALGSSFIFYKKNSTHIMRFVGGTDLWGLDRVFESSGILATRCVCSFKEGTMHFVATQNDLIMHSGTPASSKSVVEGTNREAIFAEMDSTNYVNSFCFDNRKKTEVWFCYPTTGNTIPNKAYFYNYTNQTHGFRDIDALSADLGVVSDSSSATWNDDTDTWDAESTSQWQSAGREAILFASPSDVKIFKLDDGLPFGSVTPLVFLERVDLVYQSDHIAFGTKILISRIWPKLVGSGKWTIRVGAAEYEGGVITWSNSTLFDPTLGIPYMDITPPIPGRLPAVRFEQQENVSSTIQGYDLRVAALGEF